MSWGCSGDGTGLQVIDRRKVTAGQKFVGLFPFPSSPISSFPPLVPPSSCLPSLNPCCAVNKHSPLCDCNNPYLLLCARFYCWLEDTRVNWFEKRLNSEDSYLDDLLLLSYIMLSICRSVYLCVFCLTVYPCTHPSIIWSNLAISMCFGGRFFKDRYNSVPMATHSSSLPQLWQEVMTNSLPVESVIGCQQTKKKWVLMWGVKDIEARTLVFGVHTEAFTRPLAVDAPVSSSSNYTNSLGHLLTGSFPELSTWPRLQMVQFLGTFMPTYVRPRDCLSKFISYVLGFC